MQHDRDVDQGVRPGGDLVAPHHQRVVEHGPLALGISRPRARSATCSAYQPLMASTFAVITGSVPLSRWAMLSWLFSLMPSQRKYHFSPPLPNWKVTMRVSWHERASAKNSNIIAISAGTSSSAARSAPRPARARDRAGAHRRAVGWAVGRRQQRGRQAPLEFAQGRRVRVELLPVERADLRAQCLRSSPCVVEHRLLAGSRCLASATGSWPGSGRGPTAKKRA